MAELSERDIRRNQALLAADNIAFGVAMTFMGPTTLLPALVRYLGGSPLAVGALGAIANGGWMLPQLFAARYVANRPLVKGYLVIPLLASRACLALAVFAALGLWQSAPGWAVAAVILGYACFTLCDALSGPPWFEILGKGVPVDRRGRLMGSAQSLASLLSIGLGVLIRQVLAWPNPAPVNHLLLMGTAAALYFLDPLLLSLLREPRGADRSEAQIPWREYLPRLAAILRRDARFAWLTAARWLSGLADMANAFYVLYAADRLHIADHNIGLFISAGVAGSLISGVALGPLGDRKGCALVIRIVLALRCVAPALALLAPLPARLHPAGALVVFVVTFFAMGVANGAWFVGFMNYLLEIAPAGDRSLYVGLANTLGGLLFVAPLFAGWLLQMTSYECLFAVALAVAAVGLFVGLRGPALFARRARPALGVE